MSFYFSTLNIAFYCPLSSIVSGEKSTIYPIGAPLYNLMSSFYFAAVKISLCLILSAVWLWCPLYFCGVFLYLSCLGYVELLKYIHLCFLSTGKFLAIISSSNPFPPLPISSPFGTAIMQDVGTLNHPQAIRAVFFCLYFLSWIISVYLSSSLLVFSTASANQLLNCSFEFSLQLLYFPSPEFLFVALKQQQH